MTRLRNCTAITVLASVLALPALAQDKDTVVATVNGTDITLGHMIVMGERLPEQYQQMPDEALFEGILEQLVQQTALGQGVDTLPARAELLMENERRALLAGEVIQDKADAAVTDEALEAAYDAAYGDATPTTEFNASHILVETEEEAQALVTELEGGKDFAELAKEKSTGPSGPGGGSLGWFGPGMMVPEFEEAVAGMEPGAISPPVQTQFGWHVVKLNETREKPAPTLDEVRDDLAAEIQGKAVEDAIAEATAAATIEKPEQDLDPALLRDITLID